MGKSMRRDHLPFSMPNRSHSLIQEWRHLSFLHWEVDPNKLKQYIPEGIEIDFFEGKSFVGVIPFLMKNVRPRFLPAVPGISTFPEFNIRTYVKKYGKAGVLFLNQQEHRLLLMENLHILFLHSCKLNHPFQIFFGIQIHFLSLCKDP